MDLLSSKLKRLFCQDNKSQREGAAWRESLLREFDKDGKKVLGTHSSQHNSLNVLKYQVFSDSTHKLLIPFSPTATRPSLESGGMEGESFSLRAQNKSGKRESKNQIRVMKYL